ncbi:MAG: ATP-grasp domain-containing protein [Phyllobacteriaceae bacterium]|nr:ATP-grasp domain-containing protein [Phyllobacteriaceae bacterium]
MTRFNTILVANRGEIACRVMRTAKTLGYRTVAVYSDADRDAVHARRADVAVRIGPATPAQSYLSIEAIIAAARTTGADAIHPGYGFLSENPAFADACAAAGIAFIGPPAAAMRAMGGKAPAKAIMRAAGVPVVRGYDGDDQSDVRLIAEAAAIGFPVMVKASAGGGGRGMRLVAEAESLPSALSSARAEAMAGFGDDRLLLEKAVFRPRHVEIQIMADRHGSVIHFGERDCSIQRRHQKLIEEAPSPAVTPALREAMGAAAVLAAKSVGYEGAGTVEFLLDGDGRFFFLEMNTRLQVEHPVTEAITGHDLVALQFAMAEGRKLPLKQDEVRFAGHAIEARLCAEDAANGFLPATGRLLAFRTSVSARTDAGVEDGSVVSPHYDSLLAKIVAHGNSRAEARARLVAALKETVTLGVVTNRDFLIAALEHPDFVAGAATTAFIGENGEGLLDGAVGESDLALAAALFAGVGDERPSPAWRATPLKLEWGGKANPLLVKRRDLTLTPDPSLQGGGESTAPLHSSLKGGVRGAGDFSITGLSRPVSVALTKPDTSRIRYAIDGVERSATIARDGDALWLDAGRIVCVRDISYAPPRRAMEGGDGVVTAPMTGMVSRVFVAPGDRVKRGDLLVVLEAMKMEHNVLAAIDGAVTGVAVAPGQQVAARALLAMIRAEEGA